MDDLVVQFSRLWGRKETAANPSDKKAAETLWKYDSLEMRDFIQQWAEEFPNSNFDDPEYFFEAKIEELCCAKKADKTWKIPVVWEVSAVITVTAPTLEEAMEIARDEKEEIPLPTDADYVDGSWVLTENNIDDVRAFYNDGQEDS